MDAGVAPALRTASSQARAASRLWGYGSPCATTEVSSATTGAPRSFDARASSDQRSFTRRSSGGCWPSDRTLGGECRAKLLAVQGVAVLVQRDRVDRRLVHPHLGPLSPFGGVGTAINQFADHRPIIPAEDLHPKILVHGLLVGVGLERRAHAERGRLHQSLAQE